MTRTRLVFITQQVDPEHPALAATVPKIRALAELVDEVVVLTDSAAPGVLPGNCRVKTFGSRTKAGRGARFEAALVPELRGLRGGAVVAHMCPIYAVLAAPLVRPLGVPLLLWYAHFHADSLLPLASRLSTAVLSVDRRSFPLESAKLHELGHGIDLAELPCVRPPRHDGPLRLLVLGRYGRSKGIDVVLRAAALAGDAVTLDVVGPALSADERAHRAELERLAQELGQGDRLRLHDAVPRGEVTSLFAAHDALVNNMRPGAPDKAVFEAAASCLPVLASNPTFEPLLGHERLFSRDDPEDLAARMRELAGLDDRALGALGHELRERVRRSHSVEPWARGVVTVAGLAGGEERREGIAAPRP